MNKYVAMMREQEYGGYRLAEHGQGSSTRAHGDKCATDWRAMREAWEAMVEAITQLCDDADEYDLLRDYVTVDRVLYENLTAALAKARVE